MKSHGYTLIEVLIVIIIAVVLITISMAALPKLTTQRELDRAVEVAISALEKAKNDTLNSTGDTNYSIYIDTSSGHVKLIKAVGGAYDPSAATNVIYDLGSRVTLNTAPATPPNPHTIPSATTITFRRLTGESSVSGAIRLVVGDKLKAVNIASSSAISVSTP